MEACTNPGILRVIYFFLLIFDIVKIIIPIALIVLGIIDFSKSVITSDEKVQSKSVSLFFKRLLYAVLVFAVPWIIEVLMVTLGDLLGGDKVNFTDCIQNANADSIEKLEILDKKMEEVKKTCTGEIFLVTYYNDDKRTIKDHDVFCTDTEIVFKRTDKRRFVFQGWDFINGGDGTASFLKNTKYTITEQYLNFIEEKNGGFKLYPVWERE